MNPKKNIGRWIFKLFLILLILLFLNILSPGIFMPLPYRSLAPFSGKVIDADTKEPISGAAVLAIYSMSGPSVGGEISFIVDGQETVTNTNGEFKMPRKRRWLVLHRGYPKGYLEIFKPAYGTLWHTRASAVGENKSWPSPKKYIVYEIPKLENIEERKRNARMRSYDEIPYEKRRLYISAINEERQMLNMPLMHIPNKEHQK